MAGEASLGLSLDDIRARLHAEHDASVGKDDPILMVVTIHNEFLKELDAQLKRQNTAAILTLGQTLEDARSAMAAETAKLAELASGQTAKELEKVTDQLKSARTSLFNYALTMGGVAVGLIWVALLVRG